MTSSSRQPELFTEQTPQPRAPLAERMRPGALEQFVDVDGLLGPGRPLRVELAGGQLPSLVIWGPPGCGKTSLARLLARAAGHALIELSAVSTGVAQLRDAIARAEQRLRATGSATALFVDEVHRLDRRQQDALLHAVEDGRLTLLGATTENPGFYVSAALQSRCRVIRLPGLDERAARVLIERALGDTECGLCKPGTTLTRAAGEALMRLAAGDGRRLLNTLEQAARVAAHAGSASIDRSVVEAAAGQLLPRHDRAGDDHFDLLSALHKSLRGCDPDAAAYYVQRLLVAGEDPRVVARRLVRMASEDVGLADPRALGMALDALRAVEFLGLPEGDAALVSAAIYLALAPRSDAVYQACNLAREAVREQGALPVPQQLRNAPARSGSSGGEPRYVNPHTTPEGVAATEHLPAALVGRRFYRPGARGAEVELARRLEQVRQRRGRARHPPGTGAEADPGDTRA